MSDLRMPDLNDVIISGRLTRDPECREVITGALRNNVANFSIAHTRHYQKDGQKAEETLFLNCSAWGKTAEIAARLSKGRPVILKGSLHTREWTAKDGTERKQIELRVDRVTPLDWEPREGAQDAPQRKNDPRVGVSIEEPLPQDDMPF